VRAAAPVSINGIAWDGGYGIRAVEVSVDGGKTWVRAALGQDFGKFAFRAWSRRFVPKVGKQTIVARATNAIGQTQTADLIINPGGYHHNVMHAVTLIVT
jgi:hypothetical protein